MTHAVLQRTAISDSSGISPEPKKFERRKVKNENKQMKSGFERLSPSEFSVFRENDVIAVVFDTLNALNLR
jgi:hypothetical protein